MRSADARSDPQGRLPLRQQPARRGRTLRDRLERAAERCDRTPDQRGCGFDEALTQQHGLFHGGVVASLVDVACGYAALSVMPADREVLTVEFKVHFLKPAKTDRVIAVGQVVQAGRTLTVCEGSVFDATRTRVLARMTATMMAVAATSS
ncbi:MAG: hypothetical protein DMF95_25015 [Acidobacteria bacterium]|nr:MAG: hypothetical protein DMF95_25015 [Acidobacteriota bacterium]